MDVPAIMVEPILVRLIKSSYNMSGSEPKWLKLIKILYRMTKNVKTGRNLIKGDQIRQNFIKFNKNLQR